VYTREILERFRMVGHDLYSSGAISTHGGNISMRFGDSVFITRRGSMLGHLNDGDVIETRIDACELDEDCSRELVVHRRIYQETDAKAIVHAHPTHTIFRSLVSDEIVPLDSEAKYVFGMVPVLAPQETIASPEAAEMLGLALKENQVAVLRSHGPFAKGESLEEAFYAVSALEISCHILDLRDATGLALK
jgi:L-fuculose-phosphate aldolase